MLDELETVSMESYTQAVQAPTATGRKRDLGGAILLAAIEDYRGTDEEAHLDAQQFLYPQTEERRDHYAWAVALAEGVDPAWLRDALDRFRIRWDCERYERMTPRQRHRVAV